MLQMCKKIYYFRRNPIKFIWYNQILGSQNLVIKIRGLNYARAKSHHTGSIYFSFYFFGVVYYWSLINHYLRSQAHQSILDRAQLGSSSSTQFVSSPLKWIDTTFSFFCFFSNILGGCLVYVFKRPFSIFKQYFTHFNIFFHLQVFSQMFLNNNF